MSAFDRAPVVWQRHQQQRDDQRQDGSAGDRDRITERGLITEAEIGDRGDHAGAEASPDQIDAQQRNRGNLTAKLVRRDILNRGQHHPL